MILKVIFVIGATSSIQPYMIESNQKFLLLFCISGTLLSIQCLIRFDDSCVFFERNFMEQIDYDVLSYFFEFRLSSSFSIHLAEHR